MTMLIISFIRTCYTSLNNLLAAPDSRQFGSNFDIARQMTLKIEFSYKYAGSISF